MCSALLHISLQASGTGKFTLLDFVDWQPATHSPSCALQACDEEKLLGHLGVVLYEYLGEEYPEVLGSILGALKAIVNVIGMTKMTPPIKDLLPRLTPILKNRHEKVRERTPGPMLEACLVIHRAPWGAARNASLCLARLCLGACGVLLLAQAAVRPPAGVSCPA